MSVIVYKQFLGEIPNTDPHLLPIDRAQFAQDCEFTGGSLKGIAGGAFLQNMASNPVRGIYTEDGIKFYTWDKRTYAFKGPVVDDSYNRIYFLQPTDGVLRVTNTAGMAYNGPSPADATTYQVGVPRPTAAPVLTAVTRNTLAGYDGASVEISAWWEHSGAVYEKVVVTPTSSSPFSWYEFATPTKTLVQTVTKDEVKNAVDSYAGEFINLYYDEFLKKIAVSSSGSTESVAGTPADATIAVSVTIKDASGNTIATVSARNGVPGRSSALPGGFEVQLASTSSGYRVSLVWGVVETRAYVYTYTNTYGEEGAPSPAQTIAVTYMQDVTVRVSTDSFAGYRPQAGCKVYRTFGTNSTYVQVDVSGTAPTLKDTTRSIRAMGSALESVNWTPPPSGLGGLTLMPNGWFAAFRGNTLYMSEPYRPHAWPYSMTFAKAIRGIVMAQQSIVVTTADGVHVVTGATPASAQQIRLNTPQPGIGQDAMTPLDGSVAYLSNDGIVIVTGADASLDFSQKLFTRSKWREQYGPVLKDGAISLGYHDGCLVATSKSMDAGFTIRFDEDSGSYSRLSSGYDAMFSLPVADSLYYSIGNAVYQFKGGTRVSADWWGKDWVFTSPATFGAGYLRGSGAMTITIYANGVEVYKKSINPGYFRLPSLPRAERWSVRFTGESDLSEFALAQTMSELKLV